MVDLSIAMLVYQRVPSPKSSPIFGIGLHHPQMGKHYIALPTNTILFLGDLDGFTWSKNWIFRDPDGFTWSKTWNFRDPDGFTWLKTWEIRGFRWI